MSFQSNFELWEEKINAVKTDDLIDLKSPAEEFAANSETLAINAAKDKDALASAGMDVTLIDDVKSLAGALRYCQAEWMGEYRAQKEAQVQWATESENGYGLQKEMLHNFSFAYRNLPNVLKKVKRIREGTGHTDMIQDLLELSVLGKKYPDPLTGINYDLGQLDVAKETSYSLSELLALSNGDKNEYSESKALRDKAYSLLYKIDREIRDYGKFVFWQDEDKKEKYYVN